MTERKLIPCPICHGSTKVIQGVLCCIANCRVQFYGLSSDKWYVATNDEVLALEAKIKSLEGQLANVSEFVGRGYKTLVDNLEKEVARLNEIIAAIPTIPHSSLLKRSIEIAWERGFKGAHNSAPNARSIDIGTVIHVAIEELQREKAGLLKGEVLEQFN